MAKFELTERDALYALFKLDEHEIREGGANKEKTKIQWFTYIRREAIIMRLDTLFFGEWESGFINNQTPYQYHQSHVDCAMHLTIRNMRREYNGAQDGTGLNGAKGAATDAFKRVAAQWGIGLYLQDSPSIWTENYKTADGKTDYDKKRRVEKEAMDKVAAWLRQLGATGNQLAQSEDSRNDEPPAQSTGSSKPSEPSKPIDNQNIQAPDENTWKRWVFEATRFLYTADGKYNEHQHRNSLKKRMEDTTGLGIDATMTLYEVLNRLIRYRALHDLFLDTSDYPKIFGIQFEDYVDKHGHVATWQRMNDYYAAQLEPAKPKAN